jgi:hypothetical protein
MDWIVIVVLYLVAAGLLRLLGGFAAAGEALRRWGRASASIRRSGSPGS